MAEVTGRGALLPDEMVLTLLRKRLETGAKAGERGVLLDGFPRTLRQAVRACGMSVLACSRLTQLLCARSSLTARCACRGRST